MSHTQETKDKISLAKMGHCVSEETRKKMSESHSGKPHPWALGKPINIGNSNPNWKGNKAGYRALHYWVERQLGKAKSCVQCGLSEIPKGFKRYFGWANKSHRYERDIKDWMQLCMPCHKNYDKNYD